MKKSVSSRMAALSLAAVLLLMIVSPARAADKWEDPNDHKAPSQYQAAGISTYTRGQYEDFYINYNGYNQGTDGATKIGSMYPVDVWDRQIDNTEYGYAAVTENDRKYSNIPSGSLGDIKNFLNGFQFLQDSNDYLVDYDYLNQTTVPEQIGGSTYQAPATFISSFNIRDYSVPIVVSPTGDTYNGPTAPGGVNDNNVACESNTATGNGGQGFRGWAWYPATLPDAGGAYTWKKAEVYPGAGGGPCAITQAQANYYLHNGIGSNLSSDTAAYPTGYYPSKSWHGRCGVSFPYNIFVANVNYVGTSGGLASYTWDIVNQTPLWLQGITVRIYTHGQTTGKWNLVQQYNGLDMPPAARDTSTGALTGNLTGSPQNSTFPVVAAGMWSEILGQSAVPAPSESYNVVVTANVNLNTVSGYVGVPAPTVDSGMTGKYWAGGVQGVTPPGEPQYETQEQVGFQNAYAVLGTNVQAGYADNVTSSNVNQPPSGGGGGGSNPPPSSANNLAAQSLTTDSSNSTATFVFNSTFTMGGTAYVRFYKQDGNYLTEYGGIKYVHIAANGTATTSTSQISDLQPGDVIWASVDADSSDGNNWTGTQFQGDDSEQHAETTYLDNYTAYVIPGTPVTPPVINPISGMHPVTYPTLKSVITYQTVQVPIYGWKKIPLTWSPPKPRVRLVPND